ncbi:unnamed protein product [Linum trigynum]|uniref:Uncharacterized protein n=1 Tax=Linum trigynum TaxID=586398 RepID=A0AAV2GNJ3_9ROSI
MGDPNDEDPMVVIQATLAQINASFQLQLDHITRRLDEKRTLAKEVEAELVVAQEVRDDPNDATRVLDERLCNIERQLVVIEGDPNTRVRGNRDFGRRNTGAEFDGAVAELRGIKLTILSFQGTNNAAAYLDWECKILLFFQCGNYTEQQ